MSPVQSIIDSEEEKKVSSIPLYDEKFAEDIPVHTETQLDSIKTLQNDASNVGETATPTAELITGLVDDTFAKEPEKITGLISEDSLTTLANFEEKGFEEKVNTAHGS